MGIRYASDWRNGQERLILLLIKNEAVSVTFDTASRFVSENMTSYCSSASASLMRRMASMMFSSLVA